MSLFVLSLAFIVTFLASADFYEFAVDFSKNDQDGRSGAGMLLVVLFASFLSLIPPFVNKEILGYRTKLAPSLIVLTSILLAQEYMSLNSNAGNIFGYILAFFHAIQATVVIVMFRIHNQFIEKKIVGSYATPFSYIIIGVCIVFAVYSLVWFEIWNPVTWALPISVSLFIWQLFEKTQE